MPNKGRGGGQWGITWQEVASSIEDFEAQYGCRVEHGVLFTLRGGRNSAKHWLVSCRAIAGRDGAYRLEGYAECTVGGVRGAASFPGACMRTLIDACADLDRRRVDTRYNRDNPVADRT